MKAKDRNLGMPAALLPFGFQLENDLGALKEKIHVLLPGESQVFSAFFQGSKDDSKVQ